MTDYVDLMENLLGMLGVGTKVSTKVTGGVVSLMDKSLDII